MHRSAVTNHPGRDYNPAWSPDGRFIAFLRRLENDKHSVIVIPALGGPERKLAEISLTGSELVTHFLNWSPDSKHLIIVDRRVREEPTGLFVLSVETGEKRSLISPPAKSIGDSVPTFSPDGRTLAFLRSPSHTVHDLYLLAISEDLRPQGEPRRLTFDNGWIVGAAWIPDGHEIVFSSNRLNTPRLWRIMTSGLAQPQPLAFVGDDAFAPAISRQGHRLAYAHARGNREIWQVRVPDSGDKASSPSKFIPSLFDHFSPQYSPDGKKVAFTSRRSGSCEI